MTTSEESINRFLSHGAINRAWVAEALYGERTNTNTSRLRKKHLGVEGRTFTVEELKRLDEIRRKLIADLI